jgi:hypothetical protein
VPKEDESPFIVVPNDEDDEEVCPTPQGEDKPKEDDKPFTTEESTEILNPEKRYPMIMSVERAAMFVARSLRRHERITIFDWRYKFIVGFWRCIPRCLWERLTIVRN